MHFDLDEDRQLFKETLNRMLERHSLAGRNNDAGYVPPYHDQALFSALAEAGVLHALVPEIDGGIGGTGQDILLVFESLGRACACEPLLGALMAARLLPGKEELSRLLSGKERYSVAISEPLTPHDPLRIAAIANGSRLHGAKSVVLGGNDADWLLVAALSEGRPALFVVDPRLAKVTGFGLMEGGGAAQVELDGTPGEKLLPDAETALSDAMDVGIIALCAEAIGLMQTGLDLLVNHLRERQQFGRSLGSFQVLRHRAVDLLLQLEQARSITLHAVGRLNQNGQSRAAAMAKVMIGRKGQHFAHELIQMHGGMGLTWEGAVSRLSKRLVMIDHHLGSADYHLTRIMAWNAA
jgi:alkylation response protein AidB-like acyl-CoA dehydrogenase